MDVLSIPSEVDMLSIAALFALVRGDQVHCDRVDASSGVYCHVCATVGVICGTVFALVWLEVKTVMVIRENLIKRVLGRSRDRAISYQALRVCAQYNIFNMKRPLHQRPRHIFCPVAQAISEHDLQASFPSYQKLPIFLFHDLVFLLDGYFDEPQILYLQNFIVDQIGTRLLLLQHRFFVSHV